uniref:Transmembrane protein 19 n=1 Tax=Kalanchoe fedtschenkoi TaxID=63787 RepID=A0A7N0U701_KALFE
MDSIAVQQLATALLIPLGVAFIAYKTRSFDLSGALAGFVVMAIHFWADFRFGAMLLVFFFTSSVLAKVGQEKKRLVYADFMEGGQRNWIQVLSNSCIATILVVALWDLTGGSGLCLDSVKSPSITSLVGGIIGHYSCCSGDTWSSEFGVLSDTQPRLITNSKRVQKGTNGGVTKAGLVAAAGAGTLIGLTFITVGVLSKECTHVATWKQLLVIPLAALAGLCGSVIDSLLGATLQFSGFCSVRKKVVSKPAPTVKRISGRRILDNNAVNFAATFLTSLLTAFICLCVF